jgi:hypothetical protein
MRQAIARHGDVGIFTITSLPKDIKKARGTTIALGEATGHHHTLIKEDIGTQIVKYVQELGDKVFFEIRNGKAKLTHQEHKTIILEPGIYEVDMEREFDYFTKQINKVID